MDGGVAVPEKSLQEFPGGQAAERLPQRSGAECNVTFDGALYGPRGELKRSFFGGYDVYGGLVIVQDVMAVGAEVALVANHSRVGIGYQLGGVYIDEFQISTNGTGFDVAFASAQEDRAIHRAHRDVSGEIGQPNRIADSFNRDVAFHVLDRYLTALGIHTHGSFTRYSDLEIYMSVSRRGVISPHVRLDGDFLFSGDDHHIHRIGRRSGLDFDLVLVPRLNGDGATLVPQQKRRFGSGRDLFLDLLGVRCRHAHTEQPS